MKFVIDIFCPDGKFTEGEIREHMNKIFRKEQNGVCVSAMRGGLTVRYIDEKAKASDVLRLVEDIHWSSDTFQLPIGAQHDFDFKFYPIHMLKGAKVCVRKKKSSKK